MEQDEKEDQPPFRWNRQAVFMLCFFSFAMALPLLLGLLWYARQSPPLVQPKPAPAQEVNVDALESALDNVATSQLADHASMDGGDEVHIASDDIGPRVMRIEEIAKGAGGSSLEMTGANAGARRLAIQVPATRADLFTRAIKGDQVDFSAIPAGTETKLIDVIVEKP